MRSPPKGRPPPPFQSLCEGSMAGCAREPAGSGAPGSVPQAPRTARAGKSSQLRARRPAERQLQTRGPRRRSHAPAGAERAVRHAVTALKRPSPPALPRPSLRPPKKHKVHIGAEQSRREPQRELGVDPARPPPQLSRRTLAGPREPRACAPKAPSPGCAGGRAAGAAPCAGEACWSL